MNEQEETDRAADDSLILSAASMGLDTTEVQLPAVYEARADKFHEKLSTLLREAGVPSRHHSRHIPEHD